MVDKFEVVISKKALLKSTRGRDWYNVFDFMKNDEHTYIKVFKEVDDEESEEDVESEN